MNIDGPSFVPTHPSNVELERVGDQIAELSAHLDAATARLLDLIRDFDERGVGAMGSAPVRHGSRGASVSIPAPRASACVLRKRSGHCRG